MRSTVFCCVLSHRNDMKLFDSGPRVAQHVGEKLESGFPLNKVYIVGFNFCDVKVKFALDHAAKVQRRSGGISVLVL
jgi:hypothetical protein